MKQRTVGRKSQVTVDCVRSAVIQLLKSDKALSFKNIRDIIGTGGIPKITKVRREAMAEIAELAEKNLVNKDKGL